MTNWEAVTRTTAHVIELYGDRTEASGNEVHGGLAWIEQTKFVVAIGPEHKVIREPANLRRLDRLFDLARQFRRPILLWNLVIQIETGDTVNALLTNRTVQNSHLRLLKVPQPIIEITDRSPSLAIGDGIVYIQQEDSPTTETIIPVNDERPVRITNDPAHLQSNILSVLDQISTIPGEALTVQRMARLRQAVMQKIPHPVSQ